jgi:hypothetical protein
MEIWGRTQPPFPIPYTFIWKDKFSVKLQILYDVKFVQGENCSRSFFSYLFYVQIRRNKKNVQDGKSIHMVKPFEIH